MSSRLSLIISLLFVNSVHAECYSRIAMNNKIQDQMVAIANIQKIIVPISETQNKCIVNFRAQVHGAWHTIEGEATGVKADNTDTLCTQALNSSSRNFLTQSGISKLSVEQNMVCTDQRIAKTRLVKVGDSIKESEVAPHPNFPKRFEYRNTFCRWFMEPEVRVGDIIQRQGIVCRIRDDEWQVVDKW
jgi:hypothetical protein